MRRELMRRLLRELREHVQNGVPHSLTFRPCGSMTKEERDCLQDSLNSHFRNWRETWVFPWIDMLETLVNKGTIHEKKPEKK